MNGKILATATTLTLLGLATPVVAENPEHARQLLSTNQCPGCDLRGMGLVLGNLSGANLRGADLRNVNLSRAQLDGADLSNANLTGANLYGANLSGANLAGADLSGVDLREAYLVNVNLEGANLTTANLQGAVGIPTSAVTVQDFYAWGLREVQRRNFRAAIDQFNLALRMQPDFAPAFLARGLVRYQMGDDTGARQDTEQASTLFTAQGNTSGQESAQMFISMLDAREEAIATAERQRKRGAVLQLGFSILRLFL